MREMMRKVIIVMVMRVTRILRMREVIINICSTWVDNFFTYSS